MIERLFCGPGIQGRSMPRLRVLGLVEADQYALLARVEQSLQALDRAARLKDPARRQRRLDALAKEQLVFEEQHRIMARLRERLLGGKAVSQALRPAPTPSRDSYTAPAGTTREKLAAYRRRADQVCASVAADKNRQEEERWRRSMRLSGCTWV
jgi:hypothetical protein